MTTIEWREINGNFFALPIGRPAPPPSGIYVPHYERSQGRWCLRPHVITTDTLIKSGDALIKSIISEVHTFLLPTTRAKFHAHGFVHKRGLMLHSIAGAGKTCLIWQLCEELIASTSGIVLLAHNLSEIAAGMDVLRSCDADRPAMVVIEDFDEVIDGEQSAWLNMLDGGFQYGNVIYLATTNFLAKIDKRFTNRPSRFDRVIKLELPTMTERQRYLSAKAPAMRNIESIAKDTDGFSFAHLRELVVWSECLDRDIEQGIANMRAMIATDLADEKAQS